MIFHVPKTPRAPLVAVLVCMSVLVVGCATTEEPPTAALQTAEQKIADAEQANANQYAPLEFREARNKLGAAQDAVENEDMELARQLAAEAEVLAELAAARSEMQVAQQTNKELERTTEMFKEELNRQRGETS